MVRISRENDTRMFKLQSEMIMRRDTIIICLVLAIVASAIAVVSKRAPIALRLVSTLRMRVLFHFLELPNFFLPLRTTWRAYSTLPNPWGKVMLGGRLADPGNKNTNGSVWRRSEANGVAGCVQGCRVNSCFRI
jgi:hypothetical protein